MKHLQPVEELCANLQTQAKRFREKAVTTQDYKAKIAKKLKIQKSTAGAKVIFQ